MITVREAFVNLMLSRFPWMAPKDLEILAAQQLSTEDAAAKIQAQALQDLHQLLKAADSEVTKLVARHYATKLNDRITTLNSDFLDEEVEAPTFFGNT